jgi:hypothetical protein
MLGRFALFCRHSKSGKRPHQNPCRPSGTHVNIANLFRPSGAVIQVLSIYCSLRRTVLSHCKLRLFKTMTCGSLSPQAGAYSKRYWSGGNLLLFRLGGALRLHGRRHRWWRQLLFHRV